MLSWHICQKASGIKTGTVQDHGRAFPGPDVRHAQCRIPGGLELECPLPGAPQGGIPSPVLSNIYLHKLDEFVENTLILEYTRGRLRKRNPAYRLVEAQIQRAQRRGDAPALKELRRQLHALPSRCYAASWMTADSRVPCRCRPPLLMVHCRRQHDDHAHGLDQRAGIPASRLARWFSPSCRSPGRLFSARSCRSTPSGPFPDGCTMGK